MSYAFSLKARKIIIVRKNCTSLLLMRMTVWRSIALHAMSHFDLANNEWFYSKHDELIDRVMKEEHVGKCRLMLNLLLRQPFEEEFLRSDFIDFCVSKITACAQSYAIRAYCMKLAYEQMKYYPELLSELKMALDMLEQETLSPGLASAKRQILMKIKRKHSLS